MLYFVGKQKCLNFISCYLRFIWQPRPSAAFLANLKSLHKILTKTGTDQCHQNQSILLFPIFVESVVKLLMNINPRNFCKQILNLLPQNIPSIFKNLKNIIFTKSLKIKKISQRTFFPKLQFRYSRINLNTICAQISNKGNQEMFEISSFRYGFVAKFIISSLPNRSPQQNLLNRPIKTWRGSSSRIGRSA